MYMQIDRVQARPLEVVRPLPDQNFSHSIQNKSYTVQAIHKITFTNLRKFIRISCTKFTYKFAYKFVQEFMHKIKTKEKI